jgi:pyruvate dehydrogenase E2 component (dihydrolipoamide acetyltransferase)
MYEFKLPDLGEGIHEAEILKWHVAPGDVLEEDHPLVDVETDKAAVTIPSPRAGRVTSISGAPGDTVVVGQVIAVIDETGQAAGAAFQQPAFVPAAPKFAPEVVPPAHPQSAARTEGAKVPAAPATRRFARELGIDINAVPATGPAGRVTPEDVKAFSVPAASREPIAEKPSIEPVPAKNTTVNALGIIPYFELEPMPDFERWGPVDREPVRSIRRKIARKMVTSLVVVPHVIHMDEADVTKIEALRQRYRQNNPEAPKLNLLAFVVKAVTAGLRKARMFNASLDPELNEIIYKRYFNLGLAADTPKGLVVPVVKETDRKSVLQISEEIRQLAQRARDGTILLDELQGGTFTITNIGPLGGIALAPAINYPEVAIIGMGKVQEKPVVRHGEIVIRKMLPLTLSFDHRVADGADAARFVSHVIHLLTDPENLLLEA